VNDWLMTLFQARALVGERYQDQVDAMILRALETSEPTSFRITNVTVTEQAKGE
jgi:hypothetical protein